MDRRVFVKDLTALGILGVAGALESPLALGRKASDPIRGKKDGFDENLVVFISDLHCNPDGYHPGIIRGIVSEILAMRPLPRNVINLGDNAYLTGKVEDYECMKSLLQPLWDAGIKVTSAMGNHDRREEFSSVFPEEAAKSLVEGRLVFKVETPRADFIILDSLQQSEDSSTWITPGMIDPAQAEWLKTTLASYTKPVFVCAHHDFKENKIRDILIDSKACCGYINGHHHRWIKGFAWKNYKESRVVRVLELPSAAHWGDIGYATAQLGEKSMKVFLHQSDFFFPTPAPEGEAVPELWKIIVEENRGAFCEFPY